MNKRTVLIWGVLVLAVLACKATDNAPQFVEQAETYSNMERVTPKPEQAEPVSALVRNCLVRTGVNAGILHMRSCGGTACSVIAYLSEGESLTVLERGRWLKVETVTHEQGYVNSKFCRVENK